MKSRFSARFPALAALLYLSTIGQAEAQSGMAIVANERADTLTILSPELEVVRTIQTCARPRAIHFNADHSAFLLDVRMMT